MSAHSGSLAVTGLGATCSPCWVWDCGTGTPKPEHEQEVSVLFFPNGGQTLLCALMSNLSDSGSSYRLPSAPCHKTIACPCSQGCLFL